MFFLAYVCSAVKPFTREELLDLLSESRAANAKLGVTGMLLYKDGNFMQVLEGEEAVVRKLYADIATDPRHRRLLVLLEGHRAEREFPDWSMGFRDLDSDEIHAVPGFSEFLNTPLTEHEFAGDPSRCQRLLLTFKRRM